MKGFLECSVFFETILHTPAMYMLWGENGVGKTTLALQLAHVVLERGRKVFYLQTKSGPVDLLIPKILFPEGREPPQDFIWGKVTTFQSQTQYVQAWLLQLQQLTTYFGNSKIGLIIVDEIIGLYLLEMKKEKTNERLNTQFTQQLATLANIIQKYHIPVILLNSSKRQKEEDESMTAAPHGGKIFNYWTNFQIKMERTRQVGRMQFSFSKTSPKSPFPPEWSWSLSDLGFV